MNDAGNESSSRFGRNFVLAVLVMLVLAGAVGFIAMPLMQPGTTAAGVWDAICRAAGVASDESASRTAAKTRSSEVAVRPGMLASDPASVGRGATLALRCTMCHGIRGMSRADSPNLAGQPPEAIYKQLRDFHDGRRGSEIMTPHIKNLSDQDMRDLSAYYAFLPRERPPESLVEQLRSPAIVQTGAPMRNIAPCASCHGGSDLKAAAPLLDGEPASYIREQLTAFARGTRANDVHGQMRNIARQMTPEEIETVARYYSRR